MNVALYLSLVMFYIAISLIVYVLIDTDEYNNLIIEQSNSDYWHQVFYLSKEDK